MARPESIPVWPGDRRARLEDDLRTRSAPRLGLLLAVLLVGACATGGPTGPPPGLSPDVRPFVVDPLAGWLEALDPVEAARLRDLHRKLVSAGPTAAVVAAARSGLDGGAAPPARVLAAQVELAAGRWDVAATLLRPVVSRFPDYLAAQLALGGAAELSGDLVEAHAAFSRVAPRSSVAAARAERLRPAALEALALEVEDALARGRTDLAEEPLEQLRRWGPDELVTLQAAWQVERQRGDAAAELIALDRLVARMGGPPELIERQATLAIEVGETGRAMKLFEQLLRDRPNDPELLEGLARAKFAWRLQVLPPDVAALGRSPELTRGGLARLLYWLLPGVRTAVPQTGRIASDILDHPQRAELARVVNLGLMSIDPALHAFAPEQAVTRGEVIAALFRAAADGAAPPSCLGELVLNPRPTLEALCAGAERCGLSPEGPCLPEAPLAGGEALELIRRALRLVAA